MKERITKYHNKNITLQEKVTAIAKEFQKFINFALDAKPEHADFLLSSELFSADKDDREEGKKSDKLE